MPMSLHDIPGPHTFQTGPIEAVGSGGATSEFPVFIAPFDCVVTNVELTFGSAVVGDATNRFNFNLLNRGDDGAGTAEIANLDLGAGTVVAAYVPYTLLATDTEVDADEVLTLQYEKVSGGFNVSPCTVRITFLGN
jgi:hypothetical protein